MDRTARRFIDAFTRIVSVDVWVLIGLLVLTHLLWRWSSGLVEKEFASKFETDSTEIHRSVQLGLERLVSGTKVVRGFVQSGVVGGVRSDQSSLELVRANVGGDVLEGVGVVRVVYGEDGGRKLVWLDTKDDGHNEYYRSLDWNDSRLERTFQAGEDQPLFSETLLINDGGVMHRGVVLALPLELETEIGIDVDSRQWLVVFVDLNKFMSELFSDEGERFEHLGFRIGEQGTGKWSVFDSLQEDNIESVREQVFALVGAGRSWELEVTANLEYLTETLISGLPVYVMVVGIIVSFLVFGIVFLVVNMRATAEEIAAELTADLEKFKLAIESTGNHVVITDPDGRITYANAAVEKMTGYSSEEVLGKTPKLWGGLMGGEFYKQMWETIKLKRKPFVGQLRNKRKNGEEYDAYAVISPIVNSEDKLVGFVGVEQDVSERSRYEHQLSDKNAELEVLNKSMMGREQKLVELKEENRKLRDELTRLSLDSK